MRTLLLSILGLLLSLNVISQQSSVIVDLGYRTNPDEANWGIGAQYKYIFPFNLRLGVGVMAYMPEDSNFGLDLNLDLQYLAKLNDRVGLYPIIGFLISNHDFSAEPNSRKQTDFGFGVGGGVEYNLTRKSFLNLECKYHFIKIEKPAWYDDYALIRLGYGFRF